MFSTRTSYFMKNSDIFVLSLICGANIFLLRFKTLHAWNCYKNHWQRRDKCKFDCVYHFILNSEIRAWNLYFLNENVLHVNNKNKPSLLRRIALIKLCGPAPVHPVRRPEKISTSLASHHERLVWGLNPLTSLNTINHCVFKWTYKISKPMPVSYMLTLVEWSGCQTLNPWGWGFKSHSDYLAGVVFGQSLVQLLGHAF